MKVKVQCPASCGELIQGLIGAGEKLISLPIDQYSEVTLEEKKQGIIYTNKKKTIAAFQKALEYFHVPSNYVENISLKIKSRIPVAKGMASSTADIAATIVATAKLLGKELGAEELGKLCCMIEPTDSTIFDKLTLFDHINGKIIKQYDWSSELKVMILEMNSIVNTEEFRKNDYSRVRYENKEEIEEAHRIFEKAFEKRDNKLLGQAINISSFANQRILLKPKLDEIMDIAMSLGACGVNVAHSGTVVGILYEESALDAEELKYLFVKNNIMKDYVKIHITKMVKGGVRII